MFPSNTPLFGISNELLNLFVNSFSVFFDALNTKAIDLLIDYNNLNGPVAEAGRDLLLTWFPFLDNSMLSVLFGASLIFIFVYTLVKWLLELVF